MDALLVVDMQAGLLDGDPKHDLAGVVKVAAAHELMS
jgi:nicotinamidase-related amidase